MLEVKVFGGLGNQIFQYAFYEYLKINNNDVFMNINDFKIHHHHQGFELKRVFNIKGQYKNDDSPNSIKMNSLIIRSIQKLLNCRISRITEYYENKEVSFVPCRKFNWDVFFIGYWQDIRYIDAVEDTLKKQLHFVEITDKSNTNFLERIKNKTTVSVHIRRGDYLKNNKLLGICDEDYYNGAIAYMKVKLSDPCFVFFSDDIPWCREQYKDCNAIFVDWNTSENSFRDMQIMSLCSHNIMANSTFSWWASWLNKNHDRIVVMPSMWFKDYSSEPLRIKGSVLL